MGLEPAVPEAEKLDLKAWLKEILGQEAVDRNLTGPRGDRKKRKSEGNFLIRRPFHLTTLLNQTPPTRKILGGVSVAVDGK